jgi:integrase
MNEEINLSQFDNKEKTRLLLSLSKDQEFLHSLSRDKMKAVMKSVRVVKERKYARNRQPKYRTPGYKAMPIEDTDRFFSAFMPEEHRFKVMFLTQAFLGLRIGEVVKIKMEDLDFRNKQIRIKTEKQRVFQMVDSMYLHEKLESLLLDYIQEYERDIVKHEGYLFYSTKSSCKSPCFSADRARNIFRRICDRAGLDQFYGYREPISDLKNWKHGKLYKYSTHSLRHTFAKYLAKRNVPIEIAKHLLRHQDISSTQIYYVPDKEDVDGVLRKLFVKDEPVKEQEMITEKISQQR